MEKIVYKTHNNPGQHMPEVFVIAEPGMAAKYRSSKEGAKTMSGKAHHDSVPLINVVQCKLLWYYNTIIKKRRERDATIPFEKRIVIDRNSHQYIYIKTYYIIIQHSMFSRQRQERDLKERLCDQLRQILQPSLTPRTSKILQSVSFFKERSSRVVESVGEPST